MENFWLWVLLSIISLMVPPRDAVVGYELDQMQTAMTEAKNAEPLFFNLESEQGGLR